MAYQSVFNRYELKYIIDKDMKEKILRLADSYIREDKYAHSSIRNIYFDTDNYRLIRRSIEKPDYKEKLRLRSYGRAEEESPVFVEIKKKFNKTVYKRRLTLPYKTAVNWTEGKIARPVSSQIAKEIDYFIGRYSPLYPKVFLSYERDAYFSECDKDFRITFDKKILCRTHDISLLSDVYGTELLGEDAVLMELKCAGGIPLWMTKILSENKLYKTSFSKYGTAYKNVILPEEQKLSDLKTYYSISNRRTGAPRSVLKEVLNV